MICMCTRLSRQPGCQAPQDGFIPMRNTCKAREHLQTFHKNLSPQLQQAYHVCIKIATRGYANQPGKTETSQVGVQGQDLHAPQPCATDHNGPLSRKAKMCSPAIMYLNSFVVRCRDLTSCQDHRREERMPRASSSRSWCPRKRKTLPSWTWHRYALQVPDGAFV